MYDYTTYTPSDWLQLADRFYAKLFGVCKRLSPEQWERRSRYVGCTARQVIAHEASAVPTNFRELPDRALAGNPAAPAEFNTFLRNRRAVAARQSVSPRELLSEFKDQMGSFLDVYRKLPDADWGKPAWFYVGPVNVRSVFLALLGDNMLHLRDLMLVEGT